MTAAARRVDELRARRAARDTDRTAFEARRRHGLAARHAAKLARLAAAPEETSPELDNTLTEEPPEPDVA